MGYEPAGQGPGLAVRTAVRQRAEVGKSGLVARYGRGSARPPVVRRA